MEVQTTATIDIEEDVTMTANGPTLIANGNPIKTVIFFDKIVGAIHQIEAELGRDTYLKVFFGQHGVTIEGTTK